MVDQLKTRTAYSADLSDEQWAIVEPLIPAAKNRRRGRPRTVCMREVVNTILYLNRTGCQWDLLPHDLLPKSSVYDYFAQWRDDGVLTEIEPGFGSPTGANQPPARPASTASRSRPRRSAGTSEDTTGARKSKGESVTCWSIRWGC